MLHSVTSFLHTAAQDLHQVHYPPSLLSWKHTIQKYKCLSNLNTAVKAERSRQLIFLGSDICFYGNFFVLKYKRMTENVIMFLLSAEFSCLHFYRWFTKKDAVQRYKDILKNTSLKICCIVCRNIFNEEKTFVCFGDGLWLKQADITADL